MTNCEYQNTAGYSFVGNGDSFVASGFRPNYRSYGGKKKSKKSKGHFGVGAHVGLKGVGAHVDTPYTTTGVEVGVGKSKKSKKKSKVGMAAKVGSVHGRVNVIGGKKKGKKKSKSKSNKRFYKTVRDSMLDMKRSRY